MPESRPEDRHRNPITKETRAPVMSARSSSHRSRPSSQSCILQGGGSARARWTVAADTHLVVVVRLPLVSTRERIAAPECTDCDDAGSRIAESRKERRASGCHLFARCKGIPQVQTSKARKCEANNDGRQQEGWQDEGDRDCRRCGPQYPLNPLTEGAKNVLATKAT